jgi:hypothetical protein
MGRGASKLASGTNASEKRREKGSGIEAGSDEGKTKGRTCSDSIRAFRISSLLFEIGTLSSPSLSVSDQYQEGKIYSGTRDVAEREWRVGIFPDMKVETRMKDGGGEWKTGKRRTE